MCGVQNPAGKKAKAKLWAVMFNPYFRIEIKSCRVTKVIVLWLCTRTKYVHTFIQETDDGDFITLKFKKMITRKWRRMMVGLDYHHYWGHVVHGKQGILLLDNLHCTVNLLSCTVNIYVLWIYTMLVIGVNLSKPHVNESPTHFYVVDHAQTTTEKWKPTSTSIFVTYSRPCHGEITA